MAKTPKTKAKTEIAIVAFKGFNKDLTCNPNGNSFQYEIGKAYDNGGKPVTRCGDGAFHWVEMPLDAFSYYGPATSRYAEVIPAGEIARDPEVDTKGASSILTIKVDISIGELTRRAVAWVAEKAKAQGNGQYAAGSRGHASAAGSRGHASAAGDYGHASAAGSRGHASVKGKNSVAHAPGIGGTATAHEGGAISLAAYDDDNNLVAVRSSLVGQNGIEAGKTYRLTTSGNFEEVETPTTN